MQKVHDEEPNLSASSKFRHSVAMGNSNDKVVGSDGKERQVAKIVGHRICAKPLMSATDDGQAVTPDAAYTHVKLMVVSVKCEEKHRLTTDMGTMKDFTKFTSDYKGALLSKVSKFSVRIGEVEHTLTRQGNQLEIVLPREQCALPAKAEISMEFESVVPSTSGDDCGWLGQTDAVLDFNAAGGGGCCVIS